MSRKNLCILIVLINLCICGTGYANVNNSDMDKNHIRTFTPYHNIKSVYNENSNESSSSIKRQLTDEEIELMASIVHGESEGEPFEGKIGVAAVILNRVNHPQFPKSIEGVVYQKNAFSCIADESINEEPDNECYDAVEVALRGYDPTHNAVFFYNPEIASSKWMINASKDESVTIGNHVFFK